MQRFQVGNGGFVAAMDTAVLSSDGYYVEAVCREEE
jgi:hypothetical protein